MCKVAPPYCRSYWSSHVHPKSPWLLNQPELPKLFLNGKDRLKFSGYHVNILGEYIFPAHYYFKAMYHQFVLVGKDKDVYAPPAKKEAYLQLIHDKFRSSSFFSWSFQENFNWKEHIPSSWVSWVYMDGVSRLCYPRLNDRRCCMSSDAARYVR